MIDPGEECDCGFEENCYLTGEINCCDHLKCKLKENAQCSFGECCHNCQVIILILFFHKLISLNLQHIYVNIELMISVIQINIVQDTHHMFFLS